MLKEIRLPVSENSNMDKIVLSKICWKITIISFKADLKTLNLVYEYIYLGDCEVVCSVILLLCFNIHNRVKKIQQIIVMKISGLILIKWRVFIIIVRQ